MGLFDKLKKKINDVAAPPPVVQEQVIEHHAAEEDTADEDDGDEAPSFDVAGFDPDDEESFFNAVLHMESEGQFGGTNQEQGQSDAASESP